jgi:NAD(P)-dependent dehydrogenase (short-subunit alcohol dehydrogenase family)
MDLRWTLAVVTGAGSGVGREVAVALGRVGAGVLAADPDLTAAEETAALVRTSRVQAWAIRADVADDVEARMLAHRARDLGGADVLVNSVGSWTPSGQPFPLAPLEAWSATLERGLRAPMLLTQLFLDAVDERRGRRAGVPAVVNIVSVAASGGSPEHAAAAAGLIRFTAALADRDTAARARVMAVVPHRIGPAGDQPSRPGDERPRTVARAVLDLVARGEAGTVLDLEDTRPAP